MYKSSLLHYIDIELIHRGRAFPPQHLENVTSYIWKEHGKLITHDTVASLARTFNTYRIISSEHIHLSVSHLLLSQQIPLHTNEPLLRLSLFCMILLGASGRDVFSLMSMIR